MVNTPPVLIWEKHQWLENNTFFSREFFDRIRKMYIIIECSINLNILSLIVLELVGRENTNVSNSGNFAHTAFVIDLVQSLFKAHLFV